LPFRFEIPFLLLSVKEQAEMNVSLIEDYSAYPEKERFIRKFIDVRAVLVFSVVLSILSVLV
jgi:hypothetical protein